MSQTPSAPATAAATTSGPPRKLRFHVLRHDPRDPHSVPHTEVFELIADLSVNTGKWMRGMSERLQTWVQTLNQDPNLSQLEERMEPEIAEAIYELDRCVECGCCVAACGTARMREEFVGAVGMNKIARFRLDPRDTRKDEDYYELVGDDQGVFGCMTLLGCQDVCPKSLPLQTQIAFLRRKMVRQGVE
jgi:fumarate reductase iron-sulfur subunit